MAPRRSSLSVPLRSLGALCVLCVSALLLAACVPYPGGGPDGPPTDDQAPSQIVGLNPGFSEQKSAHFDVFGYGQDDTQHTDDLAEAAYNRIMVDTGLYDFTPSGLYKIYIYGSQQEYQKKTGQPPWSNGTAVNGAIYTFSGPAMDSIIAYRMTHLIFDDYMGTTDPALRWVDEGLSVYEQDKAATAEGYHTGLFASVRAQLRTNPIPSDQLVTLAPATELQQGQADLWYAQVASMIRYMIERGGGNGFQQFLQGLHEGKQADQAIAAAFPGLWQNLANLAQQWQLSLQ